MEVTLLPDQYVLVDKLTPRWAAYARGDIVVFDPPERGRRRAACRSSSGSSACPTTRSSSATGKVYVNDVELDEPYINAERRRLPVDGSATRRRDRMDRP